MISLLVATHNHGKLRELRDLLKDLPFRLFSLSDFPLVRPVPETGDTFQANACLKAIGYARQTQRLTVADDSGLEVTALDGAPGVHTARFAGPNARQDERTARLLAELGAVGGADRSARFTSAIAIADSEGKLLTVSEAHCLGHIAARPRGINGFGYDPIFIPAGYDVTFAELDPAIKNRISHRALSLEGIRECLLNLTLR